jgi:DNA topoisomerase I
MPNLVIVESPTKAKTISRFLESGFSVKSSFGHIRDLPKKEIGIDTKNKYEPTYIVEGDDKKKTVNDLKKIAKNSEFIYFATDEDREGEAIAWHLMEILKPKQEQIKRITFHEITKPAILEAIKNPRTIDLNMVNAQQARRILDRLVGYELSPFLWKKVARGLSAGRVQSVAVRLIVEREEEIKKFKAQEYWTIDAIFCKENIEIQKEISEKDLPQGFFKAKLFSKDEKTLSKFEIANQEQADNILKDISKSSYYIKNVEKKKTTKNPPAPFITSTLQQDANRKLGYSAKQTMRNAQKLYEEGFITYMRTDSLNLSEKFTKDAQEFLSKNYGKNYSLKTPRIFKTKSRTAQEAHEAIRPTEANQTPETIKEKLSQSEYKLYKIIWQRSLASQMPEAILDSVSVDIAVKQIKEKQSNNYIFRSTGQTIAFDGFLKIYGTHDNENTLPELEKNESVKLANISPNQHFTEPPARYSDASLVKTLEEFEIGRPSTYAPTISTIIDRGYVERIENRRLKPKDIAFLVNTILVEHFPKIVDYKFTARMEEELDEIAEGKIKWQKTIDEFYKPFKKNLMEKTATLSKKDLTEESTEETCEKCGKIMVIKTGRFGRFLACTGYPDCKNTKPVNGNGEIEPEIETKEKCPECGGKMETKHGRFGKFLGCVNYPKCKGIKKIEKGTGVACPECQKGEIIEKKSKAGKTFYACNKYPECKTAFFSKPVNEKCEICKSIMMFGPKGTIKCSSKECKFSKKSE